MRQKTSQEILAQDTRITVAMVVLHLGMVMLLCALFTIITEMPLVGIPLGIIIWVAVLFKTPVFEWSFWNVRPNHVLIVGNQTQWDKIPDGHDRTKMFELASMREVGPGVRGKKWTEVAYTGVDLTKEVVIGNGGETGKPPLRCYTSDNIPLDIHWQVVLTPLRGSCINLVRNGEEAVIRFFQGRFEQFLISWVKTQDEKGVFAAVDDENSPFAKLLGGPDIVHKDEYENGAFTNRPQIRRATRDPSFDLAAQAVRMSTDMRTAMETINGGFGDKKPDPNVVLATTAALMGKSIPGLVLVPGLGDTDTKGAGAFLGIAKSIIEQKGTK